MGLDSTGEALFEGIIGMGLGAVSGGVLGFLARRAKKLVQEVFGGGVGQVRRRARDVDHTFDFNNHRMAEGQKIGDFGEEVVEDMLRKDGYDEFYRVQNNSGNGVDIVARNSETGDIIKGEVKSTQQERLWKNGEQKEIPLRGEQKTMGGEDYTTDRLNRAANEDNGYTDGRSSEQANEAIDAISDARRDGNIIENKKYDVYVDQGGDLLANPVERPWEPNP